MAGRGAAADCEGTRGVSASDETFEGATYQDRAETPSGAGLGCKVMCCVILCHAVMRCDAMRRDVIRLGVLLCVMSCPLSCSVI